MVIRSRLKKQNGGWFFLDLAIAMFLVVFVVLPIGFGFLREKQLARNYYHRAIAAQIVDGEFERLASGEWKTCQEGVYPYPVSARSATNLPPGKFEVTLQGTRLRLEWIPSKPGAGRVAREIILNPDS